MTDDCPNCGRYCTGKTAYCLPPQEKTMSFTYDLCIDFDGVLHSYTSGWEGANVVSDPPVEGAIEWLRSLIEDESVQPMIYSARSSQDGGIVAMSAWLSRHGLSDKELAQIQFPTQKPGAFITIDDRAICFEGVFPHLDEIKAFRPWYKRGPQ